MQQTTDTDTRVGFLIGGRMTIPGMHDDIDTVVEKAVERWDEMSDEERLDVIDPTETPGAEIVENIIFIDHVDEDGRITDVLWE